MIQVVNKYKHNPTPNDVYIGRGSIVGNPWSWHPETETKFRVADRAAALAKYSEYAPWARMNNVLFAKFFDELVVRVMDGEKINLVCFCKPKSCHGDIIKRMVEERIERFQK